MACANLSCGLYPWYLIVSVWKQGASLVHWNCAAWNVIINREKGRILGLLARYCKGFME